MHGSRRLLAVASNPPLQTSGARTLARVEQARQQLGFAEVVVANFFAFASYRSGGLTDLGQSPEGWILARNELREQLDGADGALLAYGLQEPSGQSRVRFREQVAWLEVEIQHRGLPTWWVGGAPRHPSRWQRYTWREHPGLPYTEALALSLQSRAGEPRLCTETD